LTEDQIAFALKQNELGTSVDEVCRKIVIGEARFSSVSGLSANALGGVPYRCGRERGSSGGASLQAFNLMGVHHGIRRQRTSSR
jgi:hypothetical protein